MFVMVYVTFAPVHEKTSQPRRGNFLVEDPNSVAFSLISAQRLVAPKSLWSK